ncbi:MAG: hypothetical protein JSV33_05290 [bacterium]|nr:MAG: hypothetical protein JSV33_05290 [bacterium]
MNSKSEQRVTKYIFTASFLISTITLVLLAVRLPLRSYIAASCLFGAILVLGYISIGFFFDKHRRLAGLILLVSILNLILVPAEAILRLRGFRYESGIQFGYPRPYQFTVFESNEKLFWRFPPGQPGINSYGFRESEIERPKPPGTFRIIFIGNSCTYQGHPKEIERILREKDPGIECLNFANPGYTSYQGKVIVRSYLDELEPDILVVSFGWNDRWLAYGTVDEDKVVTVSQGTTARAVRAINSNWRFLQFLRKVFSPIFGAIEPLDQSRVPPDHFRANLETIGRECTNRGIPVIFATEPSAHERYGVPDYVVISKYAKNKEASLVLLGRYNDIVREVAGGHDGWHLIDLDAMISDRDDVQALFTGDGLHYSEEGLALVAEIEARYIKEHLLEIPER